VIPLNRQNPLGRALVAIAPLPNLVFSNQADEFNNSNDARRTHAAPRAFELRVARRRRVVRERPVHSGKALFDRDDSITYNRAVAPGPTNANNNFHNGDLLTGALSQVLEPTDSQRVTFGFLAQPLGLPPGQGQVRLRGL
jgi:hypothetical protein